MHFCKNGNVACILFLLLLRVIFVIVLLFLCHICHSIIAWCHICHAMCRDYIALYYICHGCIASCQIYVLSSAVVSLFWSYICHLLFVTALYHNFIIVFVILLLFRVMYLMIFFSWLYCSVSDLSCFWSQ